MWQVLIQELYNDLTGKPLIWLSERIIGWEKDHFGWHISSKQERVNIKISVTFFLTYTETSMQLFPENYAHAKYKYSECEYNVVFN